MHDDVIFEQLKFRDGYVISSYTLLGMWLLIFGRIKVNTFL